MSSKNPIPTLKELCESYHKEVYSSIKKVLDDVCKEVNLNKEGVKMNKENTKSKDNILARYHQHIDNGGVTVQVTDEGINEGFVLSIITEYHGHPAVSSRLCRLDLIPGDFLKNFALMLLKADEKLKQVDFEARYDG